MDTSQPSRPLHGMRILIADDSEIHRLILMEILGSAGAGIHSCENGQQVLEHLDQVGEMACHLLLTDLSMPVMDGYQVARQCRARFPALPVIGLSANTLAEERACCLAAGMIDQITKPFDPQALVALVRRHARQD